MQYVEKLQNTNGKKIGAKAVSDDTLAVFCFITFENPNYILI
nr:MAG TPA: hypothetical protein [Caudoviricetes sp.]